LSAEPDSLSVVVPLYQERDNAAPLVEAVERALAEYPGRWELICVDDGSTDGTVEALRAEAVRRDGHLRVIELRRNFGQTAAMQAGIDAARGTLVATLDGDLQNDPADIPRMIEELYQRDLDLLCGWRRKRQDNALRRIPSRLANRLIGRATGVRIHDYGCSLKVYRTEVLRRIRLFGEMHRFIPVWFASATSPARIGETVVNHRSRERGVSKYGIGRTMRVLLDLLTAFFFLHYRTRPGHFFGAIGVFVGALGSAIMAWLLVVKFGYGQDIGGRPLFFVGILFLVASLQLLTTGVLAELVARTFFGSSRLHPYTIGRETPADASTWQEPAARDTPSTARSDDDGRDQR